MPVCLETAYVCVPARARCVVLSVRGIMISSYPLLPLPESQVGMRAMPRGLDRAAHSLWPCCSPFPARFPAVNGRLTNGIICHL